MVYTKHKEITKILTISFLIVGFFVSSAQAAPSTPRDSSGQAGSGQAPATVYSEPGKLTSFIVPGEIVDKFAFKEFSKETDDGKITFYATLADEGNVRIRTKGEIEITDIFGKVVATLPIPEREIFPQKAITIPVEWGVASMLGKFTALATVRQQGSDQVLSRELIFFAYPFQLTSREAALVFGIFILFLVGLFVVLKRRARKPPR